MNDLLIVQYAKWPELGKVKTRLAKKMGDHEALSVHIQLMSAVLGNLCNTGLGRFELWFNKDGFNSISDQVSAQEFELNSIMGSLLDSANSEYRVQQGQSLGDKMAHTLNTSLLDYKKVIIVGSDCPNVTKETIGIASKALDDHDLVIGPAEDGGYVLIGASRFEAGLFTEVAWGQGRVLEKTLNNAEQLNYSVTLLAESWDVDELEDYRRWMAHSE